MTASIFDTQIQCPYCWEQLDVIIENCGEDQQYVEDCQVCCRPINFHIIVNEYQKVQVNVFTDDEA